MYKGGLPLDVSKGIPKLIQEFFPSDTDNFIASDPWTRHWREETRVIPYASELDTAAQPQVSQQKMASKLPHIPNVSVMKKVQQAPHVD